MLTLYEAEKNFLMRHVRFMRQFGAKNKKPGLRRAR